MASFLSNARRTGIVAVAFVIVVVEFASQGGPADKTGAIVGAALKKRQAEERAAPVAVATPTSRPAAASWYAPSPDEEDYDTPPPPAAPALTQDWGTPSQSSDPNIIRRPPPRGVDFPENG